MREKKFGKRCLTWVLVLMMTLSLLPVSALAADGEARFYGKNVTIIHDCDNTSVSAAAVQSGENGQGNEETGEVPEKEPAYAAKIDDVTYSTLQKAINAANGTKPVVLAKDCTENIVINKSLTLNLNGKTLTGDGTDPVVTITGEDTIVTIMSSALNEDKSVKNGIITGGGNSGIRINSADVTLNAVNVTKNTTADNGGGIYIRDGKLTAVDSYITDNNAVGQTEHFEKGNTFGDIAGSYGGGGIYAQSSDVTLNHVYVTDNMVTGEAMDGGGILIKDATLNIHQHSSISQNKTTQIDEGNEGGAIYLERANLNMTDSSVDKNDSYIGAGIYIDDTIIEYRPVLEKPTTHIIKDSIISNNIAGSIGGGVHVGTMCDVTICNSKLLKNDGAAQGGAIVAYSAGTIELDNVSVIENKAESGAGIFALGTAVCNTTIKLLNDTKVDSNEASGYGGGVYAYAVDGTTNVTVENSSVSGNTAYGGAGIFTYAGADTAAINVSLLPSAVMHNNDATTGMGGAIYAYNKNATINVAEDSALYNNTAKQAGDDLLLNGATLTLPDAKNMSGNLVLTSDKEDITGWYHDGWYKRNPTANDGKGDYEEIGRWTVDTADEYKPVANDSQAISLKAAHGQMFTVAYTDGVDNEEVFKNQVYKVAKDSATPAFDGNPTRSGYTFMGWSPAVTETVTADVTYTAQWKRIYRPTPSTPTVEIPDDDALGLNTDDHFAYIIGYPDGTVQPNGQITRAEATTIFFRLLTEESRSANLTKTNGYTDVASDAWYNTAVSTMTKAGIVDGYPDGTFRPDAPITRAEMAKIISLFAKLDKSESRFSDIAGHWAEAYIRLAAGNGWIAGYPDGTFGPQRNITRAETATMINRVLDRVPSEESHLLSRGVMQIWPDANPGDWFYLAMQEATNSHDYERNAKWAAADEQWTSLRETRDWKALEQ